MGIIFFLSILYKILANIKYVVLRCLCCATNYGCFIIFEILFVIGEYIETKIIIKIIAS